jgi:hypothetical protein
MADDRDPASPGIRDPGFSQDVREWTEIGEPALEEVRADKHRKPDPVRMMVMRQPKADENHAAGKDMDDARDHDGFLPDGLVERRATADAASAFRSNRTPRVPPARYCFVT